MVSGVCVATANGLQGSRVRQQDLLAEFCLGPHRSGPAQPQLYSHIPLEPAGYSYYEKSCYECLEDPFSFQINSGDKANKETTRRSALEKIRSERSSVS